MSRHGATRGRRGGAVVITGASSGIGRACALDLDARGFRVFAGVRREEDAAALAREASGRLTPLLLDVTVPESIRAARNRVQEALIDEPLIGVVNNAGIGYGGPLEFFPPTAARAIFEVNLFGALATTQAFLPLLRRDRGRIVMLSSSAGRIATPFNGIYSAAKHALEGLSDALRLELRPWGIWVAVIEPASVATPMWEKPLTYWGSSRREEIPPEVRALYGEALEAMGRRLEGVTERAIPPRAVVKAVRHALTSRRPKTRYAVGRDARLAELLLRRLPDRWRDRVLARYFGLRG